ncbi:MAG: VWA domain-containing protein [Gammaproteobacteria bacterium]|nr:VWA domain-containing protein [Gammaproteobacteria bacterium]MCP5199438.1 VWA domain-containing protein [Gammaproteobacteria bacterium]
MLIELFYKLRKVQVPVSITEYLSLLAALDARVAEYSIDNFYYLARAALIKDERYFDRFDQVFAEYYRGKEMLFDEIFGEIPLEWLRKQKELNLTEEEKAQIEALGGWDKLMETLRERLAEQQKEHHGGNKWIGTGGTSPFGAHGYNPEGVRIGQEEGRQGRAVKVWDRRDFKNLDDQVQLGTRNIKVALRQLRRFAREGATEELDLDDTIRSTARNAGLLDIKMVPERHNAVKVLLFLDVGGSMDPYVKVCEELFSAARAEFKHLEHYYFHNFLYESVWRDNNMRANVRVPTSQVMHTYGADHKIVFVGDATMSPYEIMAVGGSVEHWNEEAGATWMARLMAIFPYAVWLNPQPEEYWGHIPSIGMVKELMSERMFPLTMDGLERAMKALKKAH